MKCLKCIEEGEKSCVMIDGCTSTLMSHNAFYDEEGVYHIHDINRIMQHLHCSRGHHWEQEKVNKCPNCDWSNK